jgi:hypothetical protein
VAFHACTYIRRAGVERFAEFHHVNTKRAKRLFKKRIVAFSRNERWGTSSQFAPHAEFINGAEEIVQTWPIAGPGFACPAGTRNRTSRTTDMVEG